MPQIFDDGSELDGQPTRIASYTDPERESILLLGRDTNNMIRVSNTAHVDIVLKNDFDKQRHKHQNFGRKVFLGIAFAEILVEYVMMPDEEPNFWQNVLPLLRPKGKAGSSNSLQVSNYQLNRAGITTVNVLEAKIGRPSSREGRKIDLKLEEWSTGPTEPKPTKDVEQFDPSPGGLIDQDIKKGATRNNT